MSSFSRSTGASAKISVSSRNFMRSSLSPSMAARTAVIACPLGQDGPFLCECPESVACICCGLANGLSINAEDLAVLDDGPTVHQRVTDVSGGGIVDHGPHRIEHWGCEGSV